MSALGQKQTCAVQNAMSALPPKAASKADIRQSGLSLSLADSAAIHALTGRCPDARGRDIR